MTEWTDSKINKLKLLWERGVPTAEMGKQLGFSKNAIVGKVHRLGLSNRTSPIKSPVKTKVKKEINLIQKDSSQESSKKVKNIKLNLKDGVSLINLTSTSCCWPLDEVVDGNFHFCGKQVFKNKPYCLEHCIMAYSNITNVEDKGNNN